MARSNVLCSDVYPTQKPTYTMIWYGIAMYATMDVHPSTNGMMTLATNRHSNTARNTGRRRRALLLFATRWRWFDACATVSHHNPKLTVAKYASVMLAYCSKTMASCNTQAFCSPSGMLTLSGCVAEMANIVCDAKKKMADTSTCASVSGSGSILQLPFCSARRRTRSHAAKPSTTAATMARIDPDAVHHRDPAACSAHATPLVPYQVEHPHPRGANVPSPMSTSGSADAFHHLRPL